LSIPDYPYLTKEPGDLIGKNTNFVAKAAAVPGLKGDEKYHQSIRSSKSGGIHRYSEAARTKLQQKIAEDPLYSPYQAAAP
jgi:hypothetical protein